jgi:hypothetical protein
MRLFYFALIVTGIAGAEVPRTHLLESFGSLPLSFQKHGSQFVSRGPGYSLHVTASHAVLQLRGGAVHLRVVGAEPHPPIEALDHIRGATSSILGSDVRETSQHYARVRCRSIYPGIDLVFHGSQNRLEYDFHVGPHRDPDAIALAFE